MLIFLVILIFFGPKKIPELAGQFGRGLRKFREAKEGFESQIRTAMKEPMEEIQKAKTNFDKSLNEAKTGFETQVNAAMNDAAEPLAEVKQEFLFDEAQIARAASRPPIPLHHVPSEQPVEGGVIIHKIAP